MLDAYDVNRKEYFSRCFSLLTCFLAFLFSRNFPGYDF